MLMNSNGIHLRYTNTRTDMKSIIHFRINNIINDVLTYLLTYLHAIRA